MVFPMSLDKTVGDDQRITVEIESDKRASAGYVTVKRRVVLTFPERCVVVPVS